MKNFNLITDLLHCIRVKDRYPLLLKTKSRSLTYIVGKTGDLTALKWNTFRYEYMKGKTNAEVLVIVQQDNYLEWKMVYVNSKGYFIKKDNQNIYFEVD